ncbi:MAG: hypothetical protein A3F72_13670 [Bacteroidetes bacterium RIFCSPLOWO2_12_FULL_35_15]|nr:MAG: hypothetical protein A3F72_13670 [Bacteroidetes bacterium RIFCSPLOWO2_12_FULL_35_15]
MLEKLKSLFRKLKFNKLNQKVTEQLEEFTLNYKNFTVYYSKGTSLIKRIIEQGDYEPEISEVIIKELSGIENPLVIDIGANIGLMSISVLHEIPNAKIYAFEPGPHQFKLFSKTIETNKINGKILLSPIALSNQKGTAIFQIHSSEDASGDGFFDTERAGATEGIEVKTDTLDNWWIANNQPKVDFIKMDTEGAEYWILQGGKHLIEKCRPIMIAEIFEQNIKNYPFKLADVIDYIWEIGYEIQTPQRENVTSENLTAVLKKENTFLLKPISK